MEMYLGALDIMSATENVDPEGSCRINSFIMAFISKTIAWAAAITSSNSTFPPCSMFRVSEGGYKKVKLCLQCITGQNVNFH